MISEKSIEDEEQPIIIQAKVKSTKQKKKPPMSIIEKQELDFSHPFWRDPNQQEPKPIEEVKEDPVEKFLKDDVLYEDILERIQQLPAERRDEALVQYSTTHDLEFEEFHELQRAIQLNREYQQPKKPEVRDDLFDKFCDEMEDLPSPSSVKGMQFN